MKLLLIAQQLETTKLLSFHASGGRILSNLKVRDSLLMWISRAFYLAKNGFGGRPLSQSREALKHGLLKSIRINTLYQRNTSYFHSLTYNGLNQVETFNTNSYSYDLNGNTTSDGMDESD
jgi:hypothetical protein